MKLPPLRASWLAFVLGAGLVWPVPGASQSSAWDPRSGLPVGSEEERYLRVLQLAGVAPAYPWSLRGFTPDEVRGTLPADDAEHPWSRRWTFPRDSLGAGGWGWVEPEAQSIFNSAFPFGENDGPLWAGKGFTGALRGGVWARWGRVRLRVAPEAFWAQNAAFEPAANGQGENTPFRDARFTAEQPLDQPQRFGDGAYSRIDAGSTGLWVPLGPLVVGGGQAPQWWGPAAAYPLGMGNNAGGFAHAFVQSARPLHVGVARVHARFIAGRLDQSDWSPVQTGEARRFASALSFVLLPRGVQGLELGAQRFSAQIWPDEGIRVRNLLRPFAGATSVGLDDGTNVRGEDQLASVFFRWAFSEVGFEVYGEFLKNDFLRDMRQYLTEPDDVSARMMGFIRVWQCSGLRLVALRGEAVNAEVHHSERGDRFRPERGPPRPIPPYYHTQVRQGHTQRGQLLASPAAYGGSGFTLGADLYHPDGRWSLDFIRALRLDWLPTQRGRTGSNLADVVYTLKAEAVSFRGGREWRATLAPSLELNRNLEKGNDVFNLNVGLSVRGLR